MSDDEEQTDEEEQVGGVPEEIDVSDIVISTASLKYKQKRGQFPNCE